MARKRRKGEDRNGDNAKQRKKDEPLDTNAEILPAKHTVINEIASAQVSLRLIPD